MICRHGSHGKPDAGSVLLCFSYCLSKLMECKEVWSERGKVTQRMSNTPDRRHEECNSETVRSSWYQISVIRSSVLRTWRTLRISWLLLSGSAFYIRAQVCCTDQIICTVQGEYIFLTGCVNCEIMILISYFVVNLWTGSYRRKGSRSGVRKQILIYVLTPYNMVDTESNFMPQS